HCDFWAPKPNHCCRPPGRIWRDHLATLAFLPFFDLNLLSASSTVRLGSSGTLPTSSSSALAMANLGGSVFTPLHISLGKYSPWSVLNSILNCISDSYICSNWACASATILS